MGALHCIQKLKSQALGACEGGGKAVLAGAVTGNKIGPSERAWRHSGILLGF